MSFDFKADSHWDAYPAGLKVLAVDDDPLCLKVVAEMLKRCNYEGEMLLPSSVAALLLGELSATVTACSLSAFSSAAVITAENGKEALLTLRDKSSQIDLVLSDVYMPGARHSSSSLRELLRLSSCSPSCQHQGLSPASLTELENLHGVGN